MPPVPVISGKKLVKILKKHGFIEVRKKGSHVFMMSLVDETCISVVPIHGNEDLGKGLLKSILDDLRITVEEFLRML